MRFEASLTVIVPDFLIKSKISSLLLTKGRVLDITTLDACLVLEYIETGNDCPLSDTPTAVVSSDLKDILLWADGGAG